MDILSVPTYKVSIILLSKSFSFNLFLATAEKQQCTETAHSLISTFSSPPLPSLGSTTCTQKHRQMRYASQRSPQLMQWLYLS